MRATFTVLALAAALVAGRAGAQDDADAPPARGPELRPFLGISFATGAQRHEVMGGTTIGLQAAGAIRPSVHVVGTFGWTMSETRRVESHDALDVFQYDLGLELGRSYPLAFGFALRRFVGAGVGARSYRYRTGALLDRTCAAGYGTLGAELALGNSALRAEARDNVFCYRSPVRGERARTRNDVLFALGFAYHFD